jgi:Xaa-Pro aminopeptidase
LAAYLSKFAAELFAESQRRAIEKIKDGVSVAQVDLAARGYLKTKKLDKFFSHSLGHGVGLDIHEAPRLSQKSSEILREGMVVTVEPGVYLPNQFGIRIEDMVLVTKKGCEILSGDINQ